MANFWNQYKALLYRNLLFKKRNKKQFAQELFMPVYFIVILVIVKRLIPLKDYSSQSISQPYNIFNHQFLNNATIHVSPNTTKVQEVMESASEYLPVKYKLYSSSDEAMIGYQQSGVNSDLGIIFDYDGDDRAYAIRAPYDKIAKASSWYTNEMRCRDENNELSPRCPTNSYLYTGFSAVMAAISSAVIKLESNASRLSLPNISVTRLPKLRYKSDTSQIQIMASIYFVLSFSPFVSFLTLNLVAEKEKKIKEGMRMMGMRDSAFWCAWVTIYGAIIVVIAFLMTMISLAAGFFSSQSNLFIFFIMLFLYGFSIINLSFMLTPFFDKASSASGFASLTTMIMSLLYLSVSLTRRYTPFGFESTIPAYGRWLLCLLSPVSLALSIDQGIYLDLWRGGMTFSRISEGDFPLYAPIVMLLVDVILYGFLAVYFDNVIPGEYGQRRSLTFFISLSYWFPKEHILEHSTRVSPSHSVTLQSPNVEYVPSEMHKTAGICIRKIRKVFKKKDEEIVAVDDISLDIYEGQITALLGHNGAGKTTLINMLIGLTPVSGGSADVLGLDVRDTNAMDEIRAKTGVCPQHNLLLDDLTCREHLIIFAGFKGIESSRWKTVVEESLKSVDLQDKADTMAKNLSGGQKRKLSVAIALIGDPKLLFLDEPTAGMDPYSRRTIWTLLRSNNQGRITLLTTHFMDEADILADRKAIISKGKLQCCGSSLFLKSRFGIGYHLNFVTKQDSSSDKITTFVQKYVNNIAVDRRHGNELSYTIPFKNVSIFSGLFKELESVEHSTTVAEQIGVENYGISMTTLEEVFLKLEEDESILMGKTTNGDVVQPFSASLDHSTKGEVDQMDTTSLERAETEPCSSPTLPIYTPLDGRALMLQRFYALLRLRYFMTINNKINFFFLLFFPVLFVTIGVVLNKLVIVSNDAQQPMPFDLFKGLGIYARVKKSSVKLASPFLFQDSSSGVDTYVDRFSREMSQYVQLRNITPDTNLTGIGPHQVGVNLSSLRPVSPADVEMSYSVLYNETAVHSIPVVINFMMNGLLGLALRSTPQPLKVYNLPWNSTEPSSLGFNNNIMSSSILIAMAFLAITPGFALYIIKDKEFKCRALLRLSGITVHMYWFSLFVFNCAQYMIPLLLTVIVVLAAQLDTYTTAGSIISLILLLVLYMPANILCSYNFSFMFDHYETSQSVLPNIFIFSTIIPYMAVSLVDMLSNASVASVIHIVFCLVDPPYIIMGGLYYIDKVYRVAHQYNLPYSIADYYSGPVGKNILVCILALMFHCVWLSLLLRLLEVLSTGGDWHDTFKFSSTPMSLPRQRVNEVNPDPITSTDTDVLIEREKVEASRTNKPKETIVVVKNLRKEFPHGSGGCCSSSSSEKIHLAVKNVGFVVNQGEVLGLLGPNGAGKTTVLNMLMAETGPTCGSVNIMGYDVRSSLSEAFQALAVCPQHDALWNIVTLRQHLTTFALIEGIPRDVIPDIVDHFAQSLGIREHLDKKAKELSGGTKRKVFYIIIHRIHI